MTHETPIQNISIKDYRPTKNGCFIIRVPLDVSKLTIAMTLIRINFRRFECILQLKLT